MTNKHAIISPSGFKAIMLCPAKPAMERGRPDQSSSYADEGTKAHDIAAKWLNWGLRQPDHKTAFGTHHLNTVPEVAPPEMVEYVLSYVQHVWDYQGSDGELFVEQSLPIGHITGEDGAEGTADAVILRGDEIIVIDLKYGKGVEVDAEMNPQLMLYALGALEKFGMVGDFKTVRMVISQPRVSSSPSEWACTAAELEEWGLKYATPAAKAAWELLTGDVLRVESFCTPHEDACRFCRAKPDCPALEAHVLAAMGVEFTDLTTADKIEQERIVKDLATAVPADGLGSKMDAVELVEQWCKAIRARVESRLLDGQDVPGYKLVAGKKGARQWVSPADVEEVLKSMRLKREEMYDLSLISPTSAEKLLKATPKRWSRVLPLIKQSEGKPSVAPISDKRPALEVKSVESEFTAIGEAEDLV